MNTEKIESITTSIDEPKQGRPAELGEKIAWWGILVMILYLVFIDK